MAATRASASWGTESRTAVAAGVGRPTKRRRRGAADRAKARLAEGARTDLVGCAVRKEFDAGWFNGVVERFDGRHYLVVYEDGDQEHLSEDELRPVLAAERTGGDDASTADESGSEASVEAAGRVRHHEDAVLRQRDLRNQANWVRQQHVRRQRAAAEDPRMAKLVRSFRIPGGSWADPSDPLACDEWLEEAWPLVTEWRAHTTWRRYAPAWRKARRWLKRQCKASGKEFCVATFREYPRFLSAMAVWALRTSTAQTAVESVVLATRMALRLNGLEVADDVITRIARESARRSRGTMTRKKAGFTVDMVKAINAEWGAKSAPLARRMVALAIVIGFLGLLRFSDLRVICISGILWMREGVVIVLPVRKNAQTQPSLVFVAETGEPTGAVARLRAMVTELAGRAPPREGVLQDSRFLFRQIRRVNGYTHPHRMEQTVGTGRVMLDDSGYSAYLHGFRRAARCCCGFGAEAAKELGTQSLRSGGDTYLHAMGVSAEERRDVGQWATPLVERGYLRRTLKEKLSFMRETGL